MVSATDDVSAGGPPGADLLPRSRGRWQKSDLQGVG